MPLPALSTPANSVTPLSYGTRCRSCAADRSSLPWDGEDEVVVLAPNGQVARSQLCEEEGERRLLVEALDVPSMGYLVLDLLEGAMPEEIPPSVTDVATVKARVLENILVRVEIDELGGVVSYFDKQTGRELIAPNAVGNLFQLG